MNGELTLIAGRLAQAKTPEEVFGDLPGMQAERTAILKKLYHQLAKLVHPDVYRTVEERSLAQFAFSNLTQWFEWAEEKVKNGTYGSHPAGAHKTTVLLRTPGWEYLVEGEFVEDEICNCYPCSFKDDGRPVQAVLRIARDPFNNDLVHNEAQVLRALLAGRDGAKFSPYIPRLFDSFLVQDGSVSRQANVLAGFAGSGLSGWYSFEEVRRAYPTGIVPKDMAWMWRRLLVVLGFAHHNGFVHGAVLPANVWILPDQHGLMLTNWSYAVREPETTGETIAALDPRREAWYPGEVLRKEIPSPATDIFLSARCMIDLLGGDPLTNTIPAGVPTRISLFLKSCVLPAKKARPQDAWGLLQEFDDLLHSLWGERTFHPFSMKV